VSQRRLYLDHAPGERRAVVTLDGAPERLLIARQNDIAVQQVLACVVARIRRVEKALNLAFLDLGEGPDAVLPVGSAPKFASEGAFVKVEITAPARGEKGAAVRLIGPAEGPVRLMTPAPDLESRLQAFAPGARIVGGAEAREAADVAEEAALQIEHPLPGGGRLFIEPTQALTAIDVDVGSAGGDARRAAGRANQEAVAAAARLLRLKGLGGLVAIDLAGKGHDGPALSALAKAAFAADGEGVSIGPVSRFGVMELVTPRHARPLTEILLGPGGRPTPLTVALRLLRSIERAAGPGLMVEAVCAPAAAEIAARFAPALAARIGPRFQIRPDPLKMDADVAISAR
jgi:Ribonuclease G/E